MKHDYYLSKRRFHSLDSRRSKDGRLIDTRLEPININTNRSKSIQECKRYYMTPIMPYG